MRTVLPLLVLGACSSPLGLDERPENPTCIAPPRPADAAEITLERIYPGLQFSMLVGLHRVPGSDAWVAVQQNGRVVQFEDREDVDALLIEKHGCAAGVAAFCSTFMLWLAAESGLPVARLDRSRRGRPPAYLSQLSDAARERLTAEAAELPAAFGSAETARPADGPAADRSAL